MAPPKKRVKVAIASDFLSSFSKIPRKQQGKVLDFVNKFRTNPRRSGINYEKLQRAKDPNIRSVRIDRSYRGIVLKPESGNVYVLLWVDLHDKAYKWAENKTYKIHPETGSLQVIEVEETIEKGDRQEQEAVEEVDTIFKDIRDKHILRLGVPKEQLPLVRKLQNEDELDEIADKLPQEASEALFCLAAGYTLEEVFQDIERVDDEQPVDVNDFDTALFNPDSRRRFYIVEDELELAAILNAPLEKWRVFLHPSQQKLVERNWNGPVRVLGGAGTGKTVAAMHRAKWLAQNAFHGGKDRILFTTFTRNLAADIQDNLAKICPKDTLRKIEVINLDRWVFGFLKRNGYNYEIDFGKRTSQFWKQAVDMAPDDLKLDPAFFRDEWERVIQPQAITSVDKYFKASRVGRGVRLNRKMRKIIWTVFEEYRTLLNENGLKEGSDAMRDARLLIESKNETLPYCTIIVDEGQDMGPQAFKLIRKMVPEGSNDLFIVGDAHQRIYKHKVVLGRCGINIRGRGRKLRINYRTTDETRSWAVSLLKGIKIDDLDGGMDDQKGYKSLLHGVFPEVRQFQSLKEEVDFITNYLKEVENSDGSLNEICLVARTNNLIDQYQNVLMEKGFQTYKIRRKEPEDRKASGVRLATMHRVKGLEFDRVIIAGVNDGIIPFESLEIHSSDSTVRKESEINERALLYVAATRAKKTVLVTSFGKPSRFLSFSGIEEDSRKSDEIEIGQDKASEEISFEDELEQLVDSFIEVANKDGIEKIKGKILNAFIYKRGGENAVKTQLERWVNTNPSGKHAKAIPSAKKLYEFLFESIETFHQKEKSEVRGDNLRATYSMRLVYSMAQIAPDLKNDEMPKFKIIGGSLILEDTSQIVMPGKVPVFRNFSDRIIILKEDKNHPALVRKALKDRFDRRYENVSRMGSVNSEDAVTWSLLRTMEIKAPNGWFADAYIRGLELAGNRETIGEFPRENFELEFWEQIDPPENYGFREGKSEIDIIARKSHQHIVSIEAKIHSPFAQRTTYDKNRHQFVRMIDAVSDFAKRNGYACYWPAVCIAQNDQKNKNYIKSYVDNPELLVSQLPHRDKDEMIEFTKRISILTWEDILDIAQLIFPKTTYNH